jgi:hypothetical protein
MLRGYKYRIFPTDDQKLQLQVFFGDEPSPNYGDQTYQEMLSALEEIEEEIDELLCKIDEEKNELIQ